MAEKDNSNKSVVDIDDQEIRKCGPLGPDSLENGIKKAGSPTRMPDPPVLKKGFRETLKRHMNAVVFAEAGEFRSAREFLEPQPKAASILLVIEGDAPDSAVFQYSLGVCARMKAQLDILQVIPASQGTSDYQSTDDKMQNGTPLLSALVRKAEERKIPFTVTMRIGDLGERLVKHAKRRRNVSMIIIDSHRTRTHPKPERAWERFLRSLSRVLSIPITTVLPKGRALASH